MATIVTGSLATLQVFAILAALVFVIVAVAGIIEKSLGTVLLGAGLALLSVAFLFHP